jgi:hypothetical protein
VSPLLWSSGQSSRLQLQKPGFDSRRYQIFWEVVGLERDPLSLVNTIEELLGSKSSGSGLENREYGRRDPLQRPCGTLYLQKLVLTSPTSCSRWIGVVRSRTQTTDFFLWVERSDAPEGVGDCELHLSVRITEDKQLRLTSCSVRTLTVVEQAVPDFETQKLLNCSLVSDTTMERNTLMAQCYPKLKDYCREKHGLEFQVSQCYQHCRTSTTSQELHSNISLRQAISSGGALKLKSCLQLTPQCILHVQLILR